MSRILNTVWNEFVYGGHLLSLGASALAWSVAILFDKPFSLLLLVISYLISQIIYNYDHYKGLKKDIASNPERVEHLQKQTKVLPFLIGMYFLGFIIFLLFTNIGTIIFMMSFLTGGILFALVFKNLTKKIVGFKNFYTAFFWAIGPSLLPMFYYNLTPSVLIVFIFFVIYLRWLINCIFFDLKDTNTDASQNLKTFPVVFGEKKTITILHYFNLAANIILLAGVLFQVLPAYSIVLTAFYFYSFYYLKNALRMNPDILRKVSYIMVDGEYIFWPFALLFMKGLMP